ncbi:MAG: Glycyl-tRNA synthetase, partial [uncultured Actinomycetospora sp.]
AHAHRQRPHRDRGQPLQAPRFRLPLRGDLRRDALGLGLRPPGRGAQGEPQAPVVEGRRQRPRRRRRAGLQRDPAAPGVGRVRPRRRVHRPTGRVHELPPPLPRRPARRGLRRAHRRPVAGVDRRRGPRPLRPVERAVPQLRHARPVHPAARVQHDAQDLPGPGGVRGGPALPAARDRAGHLRQLRQRDVRGAQEAALRHRPDGQELPQRDHARQLHLPHARVRADGDGVLRRARLRRAVAPVLDRRAHPLVHRPGDLRRQPAPLRAPQGEALPLLEAHRRHRVPVRLQRRPGVGRARGHRQPHRLRPHHALEQQRCRPELLRPGHRLALPPVRHRAGRRRGPLDDDVPARGLHRGRGAQRQGRGRQAHGAQARPAPRSGQGRGAAA